MNPDKIRVGLYDGDAAVFNLCEGHVLTNGKWYQEESFRLLTNATIWPDEAVALAWGKIVMGPPLPDHALGGVDVLGRATMH